MGRLSFHLPSLLASLLFEQLAACCHEKGAKGHALVPHTNPLSLPPPSPASSPSPRQALPQHAASPSHLLDAATPFAELVITLLTRAPLEVSLAAAGGFGPVLAAWHIRFPPPPAHAHGTAAGAERLCNVCATRVSSAMSVGHE